MSNKHYNHTHTFSSYNCEWLQKEYTHVKGRNRNIKEENLSRRSRSVLGVSFFTTNKTRIFCKTKSNRLFKTKLGKKMQYQTTKQTNKKRNSNILIKSTEKRNSWVGMRDTVRGAKSTERRDALGCEIISSKLRVCVLVGDDWSRLSH